jgi:hypothetical protein
MTRDGPKLKMDPASEPDSKTRATHGSSQPVARANPSDATARPTNGRRVHGSRHRNHRTSGATSGRGMRTARTSVPMMAHRLPANAHAANQSTNARVLPVATSNQKGQARSARTRIRLSGSDRAAAMWSSRQPQMPIQPTAGNIAATSGDQR